MTYSPKAEIARKNRAFLREVRSSSEARLAARLVLDAMIGAANMYEDPPSVTITKTKIIVDTCLCLKSVKTALQMLRAEGSIFPTQGIEGGRATAVTYCFRVAGQGGQSSPPETGQGGVADEAEAIWQAALTALRAENRDIAAAWYVPLHPVEITPTRAVMRAPTAFIRSYLQNKPHLIQPLERALAGRKIEIT